jgi:deoxyribonuclease-4
MKIGIKIWPDNAEYAFEISEHVDFIEIMAKRGEDFSFLSDIDLPFVIHAEHNDFGVNFTDVTKLALSKESSGFALELADRLNARTIIFHPGLMDGTQNTKAEHAIEFLKSMKDNRIVLENVLLREPIKNRNFECPFATPDGMAKIMAETNKGMCLDFSHAQITSTQLGIDYIKTLEKFIEMRPRHFHACGGVEGDEKDMHIHLWEGNLNIAAFRHMLPKTAWVTLETPCDLEGQLRDIEMMKA